VFLVGKGQVARAAADVGCGLLLHANGKKAAMMFDTTRDFFVFTATFASSVDGRNFQAGMCFLYICPTCQVIARICSCLNMPMLHPARMCITYVHDEVTYPMCNTYD
jgi:hypothetical protein